MSQAAVQLKVAGQVYRVVTSAPEDELGRLAARVEDALAQVTQPGRQPSPQAFVLAALTLAHDLEEERERYRQLEERHKHFVQDVLGRVEQALDERPTVGSPFDGVPAEATARTGARARSRQDAR